VKNRSRAQTCTAGAAAFALVVGLVAAAGTGSASAATEPVAAPLAAPTNLTPDDQGFPKPARKEPVLSWNAVAGASSYKVEVGVDDTWSDDPVLSLATTNTAMALPTWLPHATYVWRVAALKGSTSGHWSSEEGLPQADATFTRGWRAAPTPVAPSSGALVDAYSEFSWGPIPGASSYEIQVSNKSYFPEPSAATAAPDTAPAPSTQTQAPGDHTDVCFTSRTRVTPYTNQESAEKDNPGACNWILEASGSATPLYWRVRGLDRFADEAQDVATTPIKNGGVSSRPPSFNPDDTAIVSGCPGQPDTNCTPTHPVELGSWSAVTSFSTKDLAPQAGTYDPTALVQYNSLAAEPDGLCTLDTSPGTAEHAKCTDFPTLSWQPVPGALSYRVYLGTDEQMSNMLAMAELYSTTWTPTEAWRDSSASQSYYYVVQACDTNECGSVTSTPPSFRKASPRLVVGTGPSVTGRTSFTWSSYASRLATASGLSATSDAYAYRVQIASSAHPTYDVVVEDQVVDGTTFYPSSELGQGSFIWRVQALNSSAHRLPWSYSGTFARDSVGPKAVAVAPKSISATQPVTVTFDEDVTGISTSSLRVSPATAATVKVTGTKTAVLTPTRTWTPGATYAVVVGAAVKDAAGNTAQPTGPTFAVSSVVDDGSAALTYSAGWTKLSASNAVGGTFRQAGTAGRTVTMTFTGSSVTVLGCLSPKGGQLDVAVGKVTKRVSTYRSYSGCGVKLVTLSGLGTATKTLKLTATGKRVAASKGVLVGFDGVTVGK
jgi:hypothetical protein